MTDIHTMPNHNIRIKHDPTTFSLDQLTKNLDEFAQVIIARFLPEICLLTNKSADIEVFNNS